jgi:hypothetical protein
VGHRRVSCPCGPLRQRTRAVVFPLTSHQ